MPESPARLPSRVAPDALEVRDAAPADAPALAALLGELGYPVAPEVVAARLTMLTGAGDRALVATQGWSTRRRTSASSRRSQ